jgi:hypothetical protein
MRTVNSISGGKTSAYIAANYPADYNVFSLVRTDDVNCLFPDSKIRQIVSDKIGKEFIGTLEDDTIIYTMLDLEQFIGQKIDWVTGITFDEIVKSKTSWLPNKLHRFCTSFLKLNPIFEFWKENINEPVEMRLGFRANEMNRAKSMNEKLNKNGLLEQKAIIGKSKNGNQNRWGLIEWQKPSFPLIDNSIFKDTIEEFWKDKSVKFAYMNNCVGCFHRNELLLKMMSEKHPNKFQWFVDQEKERNPKDTWKGNGHITYEKILKHKLQLELFEEDFNECDSGYCGL